MVTFSPTQLSKPWGHEFLWAKTAQYVGKILFIKAGEALSLQYHVVKDETIMVLGGRLSFEWLDEERRSAKTNLTREVPFHIPPGMRHRLVALEDTWVLEVSTPEVDDVVRLEDRYGRV